MIIWFNYHVFFFLYEYIYLFIYYRMIRICTNKLCSGPNGCAALGVGLRPLACWDCGLESHRGHGCLSGVSVVCCQVEVSATSWSLIQRSPTDYGGSLCVIYKPPEWGGPSPLGGCRAKNKQTNKLCNIWIRILILRFIAPVFIFWRMVNFMHLGRC